MTPTAIKRLRLSLGLSLEAFAAKLGVSFFSVYRWENGTVKPSPMAEAKLAELAKLDKGKGE